MLPFWFYRIHLRYIALIWEPNDIDFFLFISCISGVIDFLGLVNLSSGSPNFSAILRDFLDNIGLNALSLVIDLDLFYNDYGSIYVVIGFSTL